MSRIIVFSTCGTSRQAHTIATNLIESRLAACVNLLPVTSRYRWKGKVRSDREIMLIIKTNARCFAKLKRKILALHDYELPEIIALPIAKGHRPYLEWIDNELGTMK